MGYVDCPITGSVTYTAEKRVLLTNYLTVVIFVQNLLPVDWNKKAFERLVLEPRTKEMIYALVDVQARAVKMDDIITGKGNGLIVLLHGSPGTGKTLTAER